MKAHNNYKNQKVYIGIDVHKKTYTFTAICDNQVVKKATVAASPIQFVNNLKKWFKDAYIFTVYEAGFSGFFLHRELTKGGIKNIVLNAASLEVAANDRVKTDSRDSNKLAQQLSVGRLKAIYVPSEKEDAMRQVTRTREQTLRNRTQVANQIKAKLHYFGLISFDDSRVISKSYLNEVLKLELDSELIFSLKILINKWQFLTEQLNEFKVKMKEQTFENLEIEETYQSLPGIGDVGARILSNELGNLSLRFRNQKSLFQYLGLAPSEYSSGENVHRGSIHKQGAGRLRGLLIEAAWIAIKKDIVLKTSFETIAQTRGKKRAIVAIARKLIGRARACFCSQTTYCYGLCE